VQGTGIPPNTYIANHDGAGNWLLNNLCTTETGEVVTAFATLSVDFAVIRVTGAGASVNWRDDGVAPTTTVGMPLFASDAFQFEYYGALTAIQFIQAVATAALNVSYYNLAG
jgi:hypothetical protein